MTLEESQTRSSAGRNDPCPCGSGKKYKKCHRDEDEHVLHVELKRREQEGRDAAAALAAEGSADSGDAGGKDASAPARRARPGELGRQHGGSKDRSLATPAKNLPRRKAV
jgi:hypothetical protein